MPRCYSDPSPTFEPAMRLIAAITNANPAAITTTFDHDYHDGLIVRLIIPLADGMQQINGFSGLITITGVDTFTMPIDSTNFDVFAIPGAPPLGTFICAQVIPIGEESNTLDSAVQNVL